MADSNSMSTAWVGQYGYAPMDDVMVELPVVTFKMSWKFGWFGRFSGTVNDGPNSGMLEAGRIKGFFRNNRIEFTKYMPVATHLNPDGTSIKTDQRHPPIHYFGIYDSQSNSLAGKWYIAAYSDMLDEFPGCSGTWTAKPA